MDALMRRIGQISVARLGTTAILCCVLVHPASAVERIYNLVTNESSITVSGSVTSSLGGTQPVQQQGAGSLAASYSGTIRTDRGASSIEFIGGSLIDANVSGSWSPLADGAAGTAPADYGGRVSFLFGTIVGTFAGRDFAADLTSGALGVDGGGNFDLSGASATFTNGSIAYRIAAVEVFGAESIIGESTALSGIGMLTGSMVETLTIPINSSLSVEIDDETSAILNFTGQLVATFTLPPSVPGDFDIDGDVDGADFVVWQTHFPTAGGATLAEGDADGDGDVDGADFVVWQTNFPFTPSPGVAPVPEPASWMLLLGLSSSALAMRFRRRIA